MTKGFEKPKILLVFFAGEPERYPDMLKEAKEFFKLSIPEKEAVLEVATMDKFNKQVQEADIINVTGGSTLWLVREIQKIPDFMKTIQGRVYAGSSAGMNVLAKYYYSDTYDSVNPGAGFLPIKTFPHWIQDRQNKLDELKNTGEDLPVYKLSEGEFITLEF